MRYNRSYEDLISEFMFRFLQKKVNIQNLIFDITENLQKSH